MGSRGVVTLGSPAAVTMLSYMAEGIYAADGVSVANWLILK